MRNAIDLAKRALRGALLSPLHFAMAIQCWVRNRRTWHAERLFYGQFVGSRQLFFDVGANVGDRTCCFRSLGVRVVAVEPQPACVASLRRRFGSDPGVAIEAVGLDEVEGEQSLSVCIEAPTLSTFAPHWRTGRFSRYSFEDGGAVAMTTLDALVETHGVPDFCKIDVEGFELAVLRGLHRPIPVLNFEYTGEFLPEAAACVARLVELGFTEFNYTVGEEKRFGSDVWLLAGEVMERLSRLSPEVSDLWGDIYGRHCSASGAE